MKNKERFVHSLVCAMICVSAQNAEAQINPGNNEVPIPQVSNQLRNQSMDSAILLKLASRDKQDFGKAYSLFRESAEKGSTTSIYYTGYMLFKGLGCEQNYEEAIKYFSDGYSRGDISCGYMLALCYRNGYGTDVNEELAKQYLSSLSKRGHKESIEELNRMLPEVLSGKISYDFMHRNNVLINNNEHCDLDGKLLSFDYSGKKIVREIPVNVEIKVAEKKVEGIWRQENLAYNFEGKLEDNGDILIDNLIIETKERYFGDETVLYSVDKLHIYSNEKGYFADVDMYSIFEKEPARPTKFVGSMVSNESTSISEINQAPNQISCIVMPSGKLQLNFDLNQNIDYATIQIYSPSGALEKVIKTEKLNSGMNSVLISPEILQGSYVLKIMAGNQSFESVVKF